jgi:polyhydroxyalkanoate synthase subunit PhaC
VLLDELMAQPSAEIAALEQEMLRETATTPKELLYARGTIRLYHYLPQTDDVYRVPLLMIMSLVSKPYVFDLAPGQSLVEFLVRAGFDVYLADWGTPRFEHRDVSFDDYVGEWIPDLIEQVQRHSGEHDVSLLGYCLGGVLTTLYAAMEPKGPLKNLLLLTTPINGEGMVLMRQLARGLDAENMVEMFGNVPVSVIQAGFNIQRPLQKAAGTYTVMNNASDRDFIKATLRMVRWGEEALPVAGAAFLQLHRDVFIGNKIVKGEFKIHGRKVALGDIKVPLLHVLAEHDHVVPRAASDDVIRLAGSSDKEEWIITGGHVSVVAGLGAATRTWPRMVHWLAPRSM